MSYSLCFPVGKGKAHNISRQENNGKAAIMVNQYNGSPLGGLFLLSKIKRSSNRTGITVSNNCMAKC